ncbi:MAG: alpha-galactosidase [Clostridia bacterium]|nr:alpha-galactosidase [Clostridia bacterium]
MKESFKKFIRQNNLCPVCHMKKLMAATKVHVNGADRFDNGVALTPPMGWASWNLFRNHINEDIIKDIAKAMKAAHLDELGYQYVNVDDCWMSSLRDENGRLQGDLATFPSGIKALVEAVNSYGFKMGIYTSNGTLTCEDLPSSLYHERIDAETFAEWGVEYFKYDFCHNEPIPTLAPEIEKVLIAKKGEKETITLLSEQAELRGDAILLEDENLSPTGKYISGLSNGAGTAIFYDVDVPEEGEYTLTLGIRKAVRKDKYCEIIVNGVNTYALRAPATKGPSRQGRNQTSVYLKKGKNSFLIHNPIGSRMDSAARQYQNMGKELMRATKKVALETGKPEKPICFSICEWGLNRPWKWGATAGNLWRTTPDILPKWSSIIGIYEATVRLYNYAGPGNWNDPDMLEVGNGNLTDNENIAHFSLWCMLAAPLILGNDIRKFIKEDGSVDYNNKVLKIISNQKAIAINQDKLGIQCRRIKTNGFTDVLVKPLENKEVAVCLLNKTNSSKDVSFSIKELTNLGFVDLPVSERYTVYDIWENTTFVAGDNISENLGGHSVKLYRIKAMG